MAREDGSKVVAQYVAMVVNVKVFWLVLLLIYYVFTNPFLTVNSISLIRLGWRHFFSC